jgi:enamine deaminase RidA (YjgF/YER057c/UK114 family)
MEEVVMRSARIWMSILAVSWLLTTTFVSAQTRSTNAEGAREMPNPNFQLLIPETMPRSVGYSQLAIVTGGKIVLISGQVALDRAGRVVGKDDFKAQVQQVFENLKSAVEASGGSLNDVVKLNTYLLDLSHLAEFREARDRFLNAKNPPASTLIQVPGLFRPEFLVEVEAVAVIQ